ncbi:MAG: chorismate--pyruvate lyase family protein [Gammaproteobacteria bacterium]
MPHALPTTLIVKTSDSHIGLWKPLAAWPIESRPQALWPWLSHAGSFTQKLRAAAGDAFHVEVLREGVTQLNVDDAVLLHTLPGTAARLREVHLCWNKPWVYARTLSVAESGHWLDGLGTQPLGDRVFAESDTQRSPIEAAQLNAAQPLYGVALKGVLHNPACLWARRSVLTVHGSRLLIYEVFLDEMEG